MGNLSWNTTREDLYDLFGRYGNVEDAFIPSDRETGRSRGFGFVTLEAQAATAAVAALDNTEFMVSLAPCVRSARRRAEAPGFFSCSPRERPRQS